MLKEILSISGKSGLFKLVSQGKNMLIVESLVDKKRQPAYTHEKVVSLADVAIFTDSEEKPLADVLKLIKEKEAGKKVTIDLKAGNDVLRAYFAEVLPDFDRERVYPTDIKKLISWYNILIENGITEFAMKEMAKDKKEKPVKAEKEEVVKEKPVKKAKK
jgi:hypothetical protein